MFHQIDLERSNSWDMWAAPVDRSREPFAVLTTAADERGATFSPDGQWVAYHSNQSGSYDVYVRRFVVPSGTASDAAAPYVQMSTGGGVWPKWRSDGRALFYQSLDGQVMMVPIMTSATDARTGVPVAVFRPSLFGAGSDINLGRQWDMAADGRFLSNTVPDVTSALVLIQHWHPPAP